MKALIKGILEEIQLLANHSAIESATRVQIKEVIEEMSTIEALKWQVDGLSRGEGVDSQNSCSNSPLLLAVERRDLLLVDALLATGLDVNAKDNDANSSLMLASQKGYEDVVERLLQQNNVVLDCRNNTQATPLMDAASGGHIKIVQLLLRAGADVNAQTIYGNSPLLLAAEFGRDQVVEEILKQQGTDISLRQWVIPYNGWTPLHWAASKGYNKIVQLLLAAGLDVNAKDNNGNSPLMLASQKGYKDVVERLLQ